MHGVFEDRLEIRLSHEEIEFIRTIANVLRPKFIGV